MTMKKTMELTELIRLLSVTYFFPGHGRGPNGRVVGGSSFFN